MYISQIMQVLTGKLYEKYIIREYKMLHDQENEKELLNTSRAIHLKEGFQIPPLRAIYTSRQQDQ